ncbi:MAG: complex I NDUFA9 subunit family protein [Hyphomicrobiales bacterium]|nr:complex I NDUFA9 subunit family protein [Hyphomicrobiales bacterium]
MERRVISVFGGSGFIGRHLIRRLAARGWIVRVCVRDIETAQFLKTMGDPGQIVLLPTDVTNPAHVARTVEGAAAVVNLVGILFQRGRRSFQRMHVDAARSVAEAAKAAGVQRLVHMSAIGADPDSPAEYGRTKAAGERAVLAAFETATVTRPSVVFGPEDDFFNRFAAMARLSPALPVFDVSFQPVYVGDVAEAMVKALEDDGTKGKIYELGGPRVISFRELMEIVLRETGRRRLLLPMPLTIAEIQGAFLQVLPKPPLTRDQVKLLGRNNVVSTEALTLKDLGIEATAVESIVPTYLERYRPPVQRRRRLT